jgi:hypothetical protein
MGLPSESNDNLAASKCFTKASILSSGTGVSAKASKNRQHYGIEIGCIFST